MNGEKRLLHGQQYRNVDQSYASTSIMYGSLFDLTSYQMWLLPDIQEALCWSFFLSIMSDIQEGSVISLKCQRCNHFLRREQEELYATSGRRAEY